MTSADHFPPASGLLPGPTSPALWWRVLDEDQWRILKEVRLAALKDSPRSFLSKYDIESQFPDERWRDEFSHGEWIIAGEDSKPPAALIGVVRSDDIPSTDRYLEYLWVSPGKRRSGLATNLIHAVLERLKASEIDTVWLWIIDGNEPARELYEKCGFTTTGVRHHPSADPSLWEERMNRRLRSMT